MGIAVVQRDALVEGGRPQAPKIGPPRAGQSRVYPKSVSGHYRRIKWAARIRLDTRPFDAEKALRKRAKHPAWLLIALATGGAWVTYFNDAPTVVRDFFTGEAGAIVYFFVGLFTVTTYLLAGLARERVYRVALEGGLPATCRVLGQNRDTAGPAGLRAAPDGVSSHRVHVTLPRAAVAGEAMDVRFVTTDAARGETVRADSVFREPKR